MRKTIDVDTRGRTSLARVRTRAFRQYLGEELEDGTIILTPLVTISVTEYNSLAKPVAQAA